MASKNTSIKPKITGVKVKLTKRATALIKATQSRKLPKECERFGTYFSHYVWKEVNIPSLGPGYTLPEEY